MFYRKVNLKADRGISQENVTYDVYVPNSKPLTLNDDQKRILVTIDPTLSQKNLNEAYNMGKKHSSIGNNGDVAEGIHLRVPTDPNYRGKGLGPTLEVLAIPQSEGGYKVVPYRPVLR
ncbi:MAG: hypothetical protein EBQ92_11545 [Proteobacteria bacterium]|nr:hypothetical protein [Pseudomonadota bacterium]